MKSCFDCNDPTQVKYAAQGIRLLQGFCEETGVDFRWLKGFVEAMMVCANDEEFFAECDEMFGGVG